MSSLQTNIFFIPTILIEVFNLASSGRKEGKTSYAELNLTGLNVFASYKKRKTKKKITMTGLKSLIRSLWLETQSDKHNLQE